MELEGHYEPNRESVRRWLERVEGKPVADDLVERAYWRCRFFRADFDLVQAIAADRALLDERRSTFQTVTGTRPTWSTLLDASTKREILLHPQCIASQFRPLPKSAQIKSERATIRGTVTDAASGRPIADAYVAENGLGNLTRTGPDGRYTLDVDMWSGATFLAWAKGKALTIVAESSWPTGDKRPLDFKLPDAWPLKGRVIAKGGQPIAGASVGLEIYLRDASAARVREVAFATASDEGGYFHLEHVPQGADIEYWDVAHPSFTRRSEFLPHQTVKQIELNGVVALEPGCEVSGLVVDSAGRPVSFALVESWASNGTGGLSKPAWTDSNGRFSIHSVPTGKRSYIIRHRRYSATYLQVDASPARPIRDLKVTLPEGYSATVRIVERNGEPVRDSELLCQLDKEPASSIESRIARTNERGEAIFPCLSPQCTYKVSHFIPPYGEQPIDANHRSVTFTVR